MAYKKIILTILFLSIFSIFNISSLGFDMNPSYDITDDTPDLVDMLTDFEYKIGAIIHIKNKLILDILLELIAIICFLLAYFYGAYLNNKDAFYDSNRKSLLGYIAIIALFIAFLWSIAIYSDIMSKIITKHYFLTNLVELLQVGILLLFEYRVYYIFQKRTFFNYFSKEQSAKWWEIFVFLILLTPIYYINNWVAQIFYFVLSSYIYFIILSLMTQYSIYQDNETNKKYIKKKFRYSYEVVGHGIYNRKIYDFNEKLKFEEHYTDEKEGFQIFYNENGEVHQKYNIINVPKKYSLRKMLFMFLGDLNIFRS